MTANLVLGLTLGAVCTGLVLAWVWHRWQAGSRALGARLDSARVPPVPRTVDLREADPLPPPVRRCLRAVLVDGQPLVTGVRVTHRGRFNLGKTSDRWVPFTSRQQVVTRRPGFLWDARLRLAPGLRIHVRDAYAAGEGVLTAALGGLLTLADQRGTPELAQGELMRFLAEAAWYPTALLPSQGVRWEAVDDTRAAATLTDGGTRVTLTFDFDPEGPVRSVRADARWRDVDGTRVATPWQGRFWDYRERGGMLVPLEGEVSWILPDGERPYWRGRIVQIRHETAGAVA